MSIPYTIKKEKEFKVLYATPFYLTKESLEKIFQIAELEGTIQDYIIKPHKEEFDKMFMRILIKED